MPCRTCPPKLEKAERIIEELRTYHPDLVPPDYDFDVIQAGLLALAKNVQAELKRQGRWP